MSRLRLLDLFCGAGGATRGYQLAGFHVTGVDLRPQPRYVGDAFHQADALEYLAAHGQGFDAIHASPPCQGYSRMRHLPWLKGREYPLLIDPTRAALIATGRPWVIENVEDAPLAGVNLCGTMFGLKVYRHRKFEASFFFLQPPHAKHRVVIGSGHMLNDRAKGNAEGWVSLPSKGTLNRPQDPEGMLSVGGHNFPGGDAAKRAMGIDWMTRDELAQAIPPAYTEFVGRALMRQLERRAVLGVA